MHRVLRCTEQRVWLVTSRKPRNLSSSSYFTERNGLVSLHSSRRYVSRCIIIFRVAHFHRFSSFGMCVMGPSKGHVRWHLFAAYSRVFCFVYHRHRRSRAWSYWIYRTNMMTQVYSPYSPKSHIRPHRLLHIQGFFQSSTLPSLKYVNMTAILRGGRGSSRAISILHLRDFIWPSLNHKPWPLVINICPLLQDCEDLHIHRIASVDEY